MRTRLLLVLSVLFTVVCFGLGGQTAYATFIQQPDTQVTATVLNSTFEPEGRFGDDYTLDIRYTYTYQGETYTSASVYPKLQSKVIDEKRRVLERLEQYQEGTTVTAYVDPEAPDSSYLIPLQTGPTLFTVIVMFVLGSVGLIVTVLLGLSLVFPVPGPDDVTLNRTEIEYQLQETFSDIEEYPITDLRELREGSLDPSRSVDLQEFTLSVRTLHTLVESPPDTPCENAEQLTAYVIAEMEKQGYFSTS